MKFWNKANDEIYIYGDIAADENSAREFAADFQACGNDVTIHINSNGGDVFQAVAIHNVIKNSGKNVAVTIDGICASAATLIACAGSRVTMAENALYMIHSPAVGLCDFYTAQELETIRRSLAKVKQTLITIYATRTGLDATELSAMIDVETWLDASEAKTLGFVDEVTGAVETEIDNSKKLLVLNSVKVSKKYFAKAKEKLNMEQSFIDKLKELIGGSSAEEIRASELERIKALNSERCGLPAVNSVIDVAIAKGKTVAEIADYITAIKNAPETDMQKKILSMIADNLQSGAEGVVGSEEPQKVGSKITAEMIAAAAKK